MREREQRRALAQVEDELNATRTAAAADADVAAREAGQKKAIDEIDAARSKADTEVEEAEFKEDAAKKAVKEAKAAVLQHLSEKAQKYLDAEANANATNATAKVTDPWGLPPKPWRDAHFSGLTVAELQKMVSLAQIK